jgi:hypothetical protein
MAPRILVAVIGLAMALGHAQAQAILGGEPNSYPNRPIRIIVPFPIARLVAQRMSEDWGQPVLVENRAGGNTAIGAQVAARSAPDGYTLLAAMDTTMVMNPLVTPNLPYDSAQGPAADHVADQDRSVGGGAKRRPQDDQGANRQGEGQSRQAQHGRRHHHLAPRRAAVCEGRGDRRATRSIQGQRRSAKPYWRGRSISPSTAPARACR